MALTADTSVVLQVPLAAEQRVVGIRGVRISTAIKRHVFDLRGLRAIARGPARRLAPASSTWLASIVSEISRRSRTSHSRCAWPEPRSDRSPLRKLEAPGTWPSLRSFTITSKLAAASAGGGSCLTGLGSPAVTGCVCSATRVTRRARQRACIDIESLATTWLLRFCSDSGRQWFPESQDRQVTRRK